MQKKLVWMGLFAGSIIGGYIPAIWGAGLLSMSSVIFSGIGAFVGLWAGYKLGVYF